MIYQDYTNHIKDILSESKLRKSVNADVLSKSNRNEFIKEQRTFSSTPHFSTKPLRTILNNNLMLDAQIGLHPDFKHLKGTDDTENHYIVSIFIDIQGSTNLHRKGVHWCFKVNLWEWEQER